MQEDPTDKLARFAQALAAPTRLRIVALLRGRALCVNALAGQLGVTQGAVSQHLRVLRDAGIVVSEKRGYFVHYRLNEDALAAWRQEMEKLLDVAGKPCRVKQRDASCYAGKKARKQQTGRRHD
ncbi:MAG: helix-turn-helix transcriptional regulator [Phycisphaerae bacterium]|nr:helix-turn-helix transcriptional regulator [Phycisphaerae bacterium]